MLEPGPGSCRQLVLPFPIIDNDELAKIIHVDDDGDRPGLRALVVPGLYRVAEGAAGLKTGLEAACARASRKRAAAQSQVWAIGWRRSILFPRPPMMRSRPCNGPRR